MRCPKGMLWMMASEIRESYPLSDLNTDTQAFRDTQGRTHAHYPLSVDILTREYMFIPIQYRMGIMPGMVLFLLFEGIDNY